MRFKKILSAILLTTTLFSLTACNNNNATSNNQPLDPEKPVMLSGEITKNIVDEYNIQHSHPDGYLISDFDAITELTIYAPSVTDPEFNNNLFTQKDMDDLKYFSKLEKLYLSIGTGPKEESSNYDYVENLNSIAYLKNLKELKLTYSTITVTPAEQHDNWDDEKPKKTLITPIISFDLSSINNLKWLEKIELFGGIKTDYSKLKNPSIKSITFSTYDDENNLSDLYNQMEFGTTSSPITIITFNNQYSEESIQAAKDKFGDKVVFN